MRLAFGLCFLGVVLGIVALAVWVAPNSPTAKSMDAADAEKQPNSSGANPQVETGSTVNSNPKAEDNRPDDLKSEAPPPTLASRPGIAKAVSSFGQPPGAIVCSNLNLFDEVDYAYTESWSEQLQDKVSGGQSVLQRGKAMKPPNPQDYGCQLIQTGTPMIVELGNIAPIVRVKTKDGWIRGVTSVAMIMSPEVASAQATLAQFEKEIQDLKPDFQRQVSTLDRPAPNLRWYRTTERSVLVTPYGPCMTTFKNQAGSYSLRAIETSAVFGPYESELSADEAAEKTCSWGVRGYKRNSGSLE